MLSALTAFALLSQSPGIVDADAGATSEPLYSRPPDIPPARLSLATDIWGIADVSLDGNDPLSGGATLADLDADGDLDLVVANGRAVLLAWDTDTYLPPVDLGVDDASGVIVHDLDSDGWPDIALARTGPTDRILWGGPGLTTNMESAAYTNLEGGDPSSLLLAADLDNDGSPEVIRLGRGGDSGSADLIWTRSGSDRSFTSEELRDSSRFSLAATVADIDRDGLPDIWITRDVGYDAGGDSIYSRLGDIDGPWIDIAAEFGAAREIDGMGITLADLNDDLTLDAYISDIGENEILARTTDGFAPMSESGAGRIRPPSEPSNVISSSWGSGAADLNLDGRLDLVVTGGGFPQESVRNKVPGTAIVNAEPPALFLGIGGGRFVDAWPEVGIDFETVGRAMTLGDIDADGDTDIVLVSRRGTVAALRNDTNRASIALNLDESCGDATVVSVTSSKRSFTVLVPQFSYGGSHAREVIVGTNEQATLVTATRARAQLLEQEFISDEHRQTVALTGCDDS